MTKDKAAIRTYEKLGWERIADGMDLAQDELPDRMQIVAQASRPSPGEGDIRRCAVGSVVHLDGDLRSVQGFQGFGKGFGVESPVIAGIQKGRTLGGNDCEPVIPRCHGSA
jgi:hypothetical protein